MGLLGKFKRRLKHQLKVDDSTFASYDMTEIGDSNSDDSVEEKRRPKRFLPLSPANSRTPLILVDQIPPMIHTSSSSSPTNGGQSIAEMSHTAKAILDEAFPHISFEERIPDEDLSQYPDPELAFCFSPTSSDEDNDDDDHTFKGLLIDTSDTLHQPSDACENDEYLVTSPPAAASLSSNDYRTASTANSTATSTSPTFQQQHEPARTKNLAHIFHEELSILMEEEEDEGSSLSSSSISTAEEDDAPLPVLSPMEKSIRDRWNHILQLTITGQCADRHAVLDEAEI